MEDRSSRNRHGQTGLTYTAAPAAPRILPGREMTAGKAPQTVCFTRILWIQTLAACFLFLVLGAIRIFSPSTFTQIRSGLSGETLLGEDMGTLCSQLFADKRGADRSGRGCISQFIAKPGHDFSSLKQAFRDLFFRFPAGSLYRGGGLS